MVDQQPPSQALPRRSSVAYDQDTDEDLDYDEARKLERRLTNDANAHPGDVRINVKGAFIVDAPDSPTTATLSPSPSGDSFPTPGSTTPTPGDRFDSEGYLHDPRDIRLPNHKAIISHIAIDIGGSLAKLVYFSHEQSETGVSLGGKLNFLKFETEKIDVCIAFMSMLKEEHLKRVGPSVTPDLCVMATGGGAYKYYDRIKEALGVEVLREDEMECLIIGLDFFISEIPCEVFTYSEQNPMEFSTPTDHTYPYLLVNIGSGVSMIKVTGPREYTRVGGTSLGGGTLWGILSLLTGARNFEEMLGMAERGDNTKVDMLVGDIYGADYGKIGLKSSTIASSFGKVYRMKRQAEKEAEDHGGLANGDAQYSPSRQDDDELFFPSRSKERGSETGNYFPASTDPSTHPTTDPQTTSPNPIPSPSTRLEAGPEQPTPSSPSTFFHPADISRSLLYAISNNIGQIAFLHAERHNCSNIYFGGSFIGGHWQTMATLSYAIRFWSTRESFSQEKKAYFLRHEGYLGAVGAFLKRQPKGWGRRGSFSEFGGARRE